MADGGPLKLTEELLAKIAGWRVMKEARGLLAAGKVQESSWNPPRLAGIVQGGTGMLKSGLNIANHVDVDNLCTCREARERGTICAHAVAIGLHAVESSRPKPAVSKAELRPHPQGGASSETGHFANRSPASLGAGSTPARSNPARCIERSAPTLAAAGDPESDAEIVITLPPALEGPLLKGRLMLVLEAITESGRVPLNRLVGRGPVSFTAADSKLLDALEQLAGGETPGMLQLPIGDFVGLLPLLANHPRIWLGRRAQLTIVPDPLQIPVNAALQPSGEIVLRLADSKPGRWLPLGGSPVFWVALDTTIRPLRLPTRLLPLLQQPLRLQRRDVPSFFRDDWPVLSVLPEFKADFALEDFELAPVAPKIRLALKGGLTWLDAKLTCRYGTRETAPERFDEGEALWMPDPEKSTRYCVRDLVTEQAATSELRRAGFQGPDTGGNWRLNGEAAVLTFFARQLPRLEKQWEVTIEESLRETKARKCEHIEPVIRIGAGNEAWFDLSVAFESSEGERLSPADLQRLLLSGESRVRLKGGKIGLVNTSALEEFENVLRDANPDQHEGTYRIAMNQATYVESSLSGQAGWRIEASGDWLARARQQTSGLAAKRPPLATLDDRLRGYQRAGVDWLWMLRQRRLGGVLADEMGLGKTLQALGYLEAVRMETRGAPRKLSLVICPTSLVANWLAEAGRFAPGMRVCAWHGAARQNRRDEALAADLIVTSYALAKRDHDWLRTLELDTVILDEAQHIKNRETQNAQSVKGLRAGYRFVLTGTPIENSVSDLWSIFDFLMPGYLGTATDFKERYEAPIVRDHDTAAQARLSRRVRPFLLRRLKRDVAPELPPRVEQISYCELNPQQNALYRQLLEAGRKEILASAGKEGTAAGQRGRMMVLTTLLRLRQVCCDLRLLNLPEQAKPVDMSGKVELFLELLDEALDGGHRILVFSQFTSMLHLLQEHLDARTIPFCYLDGQTRDRQAVVDKFQSQADIPVFLISLKAGGVGLNLTAADTVFIFDPWWNPAAEAQAADRAHRIGQRRVVTSYKLIAKGTVEEKMLRLQERKREIFGATLDTEERVIESLSWEEIQDLLATE